MHFILRINFPGFFQRFDILEITPRCAETARRFANSVTENTTFAFQLSFTSRTTKTNRKTMNSRSAAQMQQI